MNDRTLLGPWIRRFLLDHVVAERNLARNTQASYRDTLALLLPFVSATTTTPIDRLAIEALSPITVRRFLEHLEHDRRCSGATRNQRLGAIRSLAKFIGMHSPEHLAWCAEIRAIPFKKTAQPAMAYLDKPEMDGLLKIPNRRTEQGARDHALLLFLYNTGARVDEAAHVTVTDLALGTSPSVRLIGKGNKTRSCPLWPLTAEVLKRLVLGRAPLDPVFRNRRGQPLTHGSACPFLWIERSRFKRYSSEPARLSEEISAFDHPGPPEALAGLRKLGAGGHLVIPHWKAKCPVLVEEVVHFRFYLRRDGRERGVILLPQCAHHCGSSGRDGSHEQVGRWPLDHHRPAVDVDLAESGVFDQCPELNAVAQREPRQCPSLSSKTAFQCTLNRRVRWAVLRGAPARDP
jgi:site-specific recombinase XerD